MAALLETHVPDWRAELRQSYTSIAELVDAGLLDAADGAKLAAIEQAYQIRIPRYYAALMSQSADCPIRLQALPHLCEHDPELPDWAQRWSQQCYGRSVPWIADAIGDVAKLGAPRITHRYESRVIVHISSACALYCRFCFRKSHLNDADRVLYDGTLQPALDYIAAHPEIREVILTGGDPLSVSDLWLGRFLGALEQISHIKHVRLHSRMAVTLPSRLTTDFADQISDRRMPVSLMSHFNHPREITAEARAALHRLRRRGVPLYNQTVLLRGINATASILSDLFNELYEQGVRPFYLHHPDWTPGTFHFRVPIAYGQDLMRDLMGRLPGPALPAYVLDIPQGAGKVRLESASVRLIEQRSDTKIGGALYELIAPHTREGAGKTTMYADFYQGEQIASALESSQSLSLAT